MEPLETFEADGFTVEIHVDEDCASPREHDTLGTIVAWHRRYDLGDKPKQYATPDDFHTFLARERPSLVLPVYMFDHSGIALATTDFGDPWDSGQVGYIYATADAIRRTYDVRRLSAATLERARRLLIAEIDEYGSYVNGECYGNVIKDAAGDEIEACWGYIGIENARNDGAHEARRTRLEHRRTAKAASIS